MSLSLNIDPISAISSAVSDVVGKVLDKIPDPAAKAAAQFQLAQLQQQGVLAQLAADTDLAKAQIGVNNTEAQSRDLFTAGWRPFVGWTCGVGLAVQFIVSPLTAFGTQLALGKAVTMPSLDMGTLMTLLFGLLGLGAMRTVEKVQGAAK